MTKTIKTTKTELSIETVAADLAVAGEIAGWKTEQAAGGWFDEPYESAGAMWVGFKRTYGAVAVEIVLNVVAADRYSTPFVGPFSVEGHTTYNGRTFTRRGIDCASCWLVPSKEPGTLPNCYLDLASLLAGEAERCVLAHARNLSKVPVPGTAFRVQPTWFAEAAAKLRAGKTVSLTPAGFGTGVEIRKGSPRRFERRATPELERAIGLSPLTLSNIDCD